MLIGTVAVFSGAARCGFVSYDDDLYVTAAPAVRDGLSWQAVQQAFAGFQAGNWHPLTTLSLALDATLGGLDPALFHLHNVFLHALAAALLVIALARLGGRVWAAAGAAALFAIHPLRVESVVWISSRKDVLAGVFFMLVLLAWERYARSPSARRMGVVCLALAGGLMAKPTLVVIPAIVMILDVWPLGRARGDGARWRRLVALAVEKWPLFALSVLLSAVVVAAQRGAAAVVGLDVTSPAQRAANGAIAAVLYLVKWVWPAGLAVHYPWHPPSAAAAAASLLLLAALGAGALALRRRAPWVAAGLAWYLVALVPVIGLVQVGNQAMADRYTYLALIGPAFAVAWTLESVARRGAAERRAAAAASLAVAAVLAVLTVRQTMVWKDSITLWRHTLAVTEDNAKAHVSLGKELIATGRQREGAEQLRAALVVDPGHADAANDLAVIAYAEGRHGDALALWKIALARRPTDPGILSNIGLGHAARSEWEAAAGSFAESLARRPDHGDTLVGLGVARAALGELGEAERFLRRAAKVNPRSVLAWDHLGRVLSLQGDCGGAADAWRQALAVEPGDRWAQRSLAWLLATSPDARCRDARKALVLAGELASSGAADDLEVLAAAHAAQGAYDQAVAAQQRAVDAAPPGPGREQALARLDAYRGGRSPAASGSH